MFQCTHGLYVPQQANELYGTGEVARHHALTKITSQRLLDQSQAGVYRGKRHIPPHFGFFGPIGVPYPKGLNC